VRVVIGRELTKIHEEFLRGSAEELLKHFAEHTPRGEMVILFNIRIVSTSLDDRSEKKRAASTPPP